MNANALGKTFAVIGFGVIAIVVIIITLKEVRQAQGPRERRFVFFSNFILWVLLILAAVFLNLRGFVGMMIYYFAAKAINQRRLDIRMDEGIEEQKRRFQTRPPAGGGRSDAAGLARRAPGA